MNEITERYTCPCCGYKVFEEAAGSYNICPICFWEDDAVQLRYLGSGGANLNLIESQQNFIKFGACEERLKNSVRKPTPQDIKDPKWRTVNPDIDKILNLGSRKEYFDSIDQKQNNNLYYWLQ